MKWTKFSDKLPPNIENTHIRYADGDKLHYDYYHWVDSKGQEIDLEYDVTTDSNPTPSNAVALHFGQWGAGGKHEFDEIEWLDETQGHMPNYTRVQKGNIRVDLPEGSYVVPPGLQEGVHMGGYSSKGGGPILYPEGGLTRCWTPERGWETLTEAEVRQRFPGYFVETTCDPTVTMEKHLNDLQKDKEENLLGVNYMTTRPLTFEEWMEIDKAEIVKMMMERDRVDNLRQPGTIVTKIELDLVRYHRDEISFIEFIKLHFPGQMRRLLAEQHRNTRHAAIEVVLDQWGLYLEKEERTDSDMIDRIERDIMNLEQRSPL